VQEIQGKAILFARKALTFPELGPWLAALQAGVDLDQTEYADIPQAGEVIEQGRPVLTLFASAATPAECLGKLQEKAQALDRRLWG
jgi:predicted ATP-grasp superfamily ATP-dependent carboligase